MEAILWRFRLIQFKLLDSYKALNSKLLKMFMFYTLLVKLSSSNKTFNTENSKDLMKYS